MYKIYIKDVPLYLEPFDQYQNGDAENLTAIYVNKPVSLLQYIDTLEKENQLKSIHIYAIDLDKLKKDFLQLFDIQEAAGGLVFNEDNNLLTIFRRGFWDLPKGKIDQGETKEEASIREVEEETGVTDLERKELIGETFHAFKNRHGKRVLKRSYWYEMRTKNQLTSPQAEEDIEKAEWIPAEEFYSNYKPLFRNIKEIVKTYLDSKSKM